MQGLLEQVLHEPTRVAIGNRQNAVQGMLQRELLFCHVGSGDGEAG